MEVKDIKDSIDTLHKTVGEKLDTATKSINDNVDAKLKETESNLEAKAAEQVKAVKDEVDKLRQEYEEKEAKRGTQFGQQQQKTFNVLLAETLMENQDAIMKFMRKETKSVSLEFKAVGDMSISNNYTGGTVQLNDSGRSGIIANPNRKMHVRDIPELPKGTMTGSQFPYLKENGAGEGSITTVAEGATKPQIDLDLIEATAQAEYVAGFLVATRKMLADVPGFISWLQARLLEKLLVAEDNQLINGDGTSPNISGITDTGNFTAASGAATVDIEQIIQAISQLEELEREANGILLRPSDYWNILLNKASTSGEYDLPGVVTVDANGQLRIAGVNVYRTTAMTVDKFIVGDFRMGALLLQREAPRIEFFEQDSTNVRSNKVTVRVEERIAFPIFGSDYFIYGDFGNVA